MFPGNKSYTSHLSMLLKKHNFIFYNEVIAPAHAIFHVCVSVFSSLVCTVVAIRFPILPCIIRYILDKTRNIKNK